MVKRSSHDDRDDISFPGLEDDGEKITEGNHPDSPPGNSDHDRSIVSDIKDSEPDEINLDDDTTDSLGVDDKPRWEEDAVTPEDYPVAGYDAFGVVADIGDDIPDDDEGYLPEYDPTASDIPASGIGNDKPKKQLSVPVIIAGVVGVAALIAAASFLLIPNGNDERPSVTITSEPTIEETDISITSTDDVSPPVITDTAPDVTTAGSGSEERIRSLEEELEKANERAAKAEEEARSERSPVVRTTTVTEREEPETITSTVPGPERIVTRTVPGAERTVTRDVPGPERVVTSEVPGPTRTVTSTVPGGRVTVTTTIIERLR